METNWTNDREIFEIAVAQAQSCMADLNVWLSSASSDDLAIVINHNASGVYLQQIKMAASAIQMITDASILLKCGKGTDDQIQVTLRASITAIGMLADTVQRAVDLAFDIPKKLVSIKNKDKADRHHARPGGSRENAKEMCQLWASGNYKSRDKCADIEHSRMNISRTTARKYLINSPDPVKQPLKLTV